MRSLLVALALAPLLPAFAQDLPAACESALAHPLPAEHQPDAAARARLKTCSAEGLYYADEPDYEDARLCAYLELEGEEAIIGGAPVLMMVYANGYGVERDLALARRFACETGGAPAEVEGRLAHLAELDEGAAEDAPFDLCDDVTSGYMMGVCASRDADVRARGRQREWDALMAGWTPAERAAWAVLRAAADAFFTARTEGEVDMSGTMRNALYVGERESLEEALLKDVQAFEAGRLPRGDAAALQVADAALNASYGKARRAATPDEEDGYSALGTIRPEGIRDAERAWLKYRDAWVRFGAQKYPAVTAEAWLDHFTRQREAQLRELAGES